MSDSICQRRDIAFRLGLVGDARVGSQIAAARLALGWTQERLAEETGLGVVSLSRYENGHQEPKVGALFRISQATGRDVSWFFMDPEYAEVMDDLNAEFTPDDDFAQAMSELNAEFTAPDERAEWDQIEQEYLEDTRPGGPGSRRYYTGDPRHDDELDDDGPVEVSGETAELNRKRGRHRSRREPELGPEPPAQDPVTALAASGGSSLELAALMRVLGEMRDQQSAFQAQQLAALEDLKRQQGEAQHQQTEAIRELRSEIRGDVDDLQKHVGNLHQRFELLEHTVRQQTKFNDGKFMRSRRSPPPAGAPTEG